VLVEGVQAAFSSRARLHVPSPVASTVPLRVEASMRSPDAPSSMCAGRSPSLPRPPPLTAGCLAAPLSTACSVVPLSAATASSPLRSVLGGAPLRGGGLLPFPRRARSVAPLFVVCSAMAAQRFGASPMCCSDTSPMRRSDAYPVKATRCSMSSRRGAAP
jgi:hypothetical protein